GDSRSVADRPDRARSEEDEERGDRRLAQPRTRPKHRGDHQEGEGARRGDPPRSEEDQATGEESERGQGDAFEHGSEGGPSPANPRPGQQQGSRGEHTSGVAQPPRGPRFAEREGGRKDS